MMSATPVHVRPKRVADELTWEILRDEWELLLAIGSGPTDVATAAKRLGEEVGATVFGRVALDIVALRDFLSHHLARFEVPRYIRVVDSPLPRTASGKILKRTLRDEAVKQLTHVT